MIANINIADADKQAKILYAEGCRIAQIKKSTAQSEALGMISKAL